MTRARLRPVVLVACTALSACAGDSTEFGGYVTVTSSATGSEGDDDADGTAGAQTDSAGTTGGASADGSTSIDPSAESTSLDPSADDSTSDGSTSQASSSSTDPSGTTAAAVCGDGVADPGEDCDMDDLAGQDCNSLGLGFDGGVLGCTAGCVIDTTDCVVGGGGDSCMGLCGQPYDRTLNCQCDPECLGFGDCCADICPMCNGMGGIDCDAVPSCEGLCGNPYDDMAPCQCDSECLGFGDCCEDICPMCDAMGGVDCSGAGGECCVATPGVPGCGDAAIQDCVCANDAFCCDTEWDGQCVGEATNDCMGCGGGMGMSGDCCTVTSGTAGCTDMAIQDCVCGFDAFCCDTEWDQQCVDEATNDCMGCA